MAETDDVDGDGDFTLQGKTARSPGSVHSSDSLSIHLPSTLKTTMAVPTALQYLLIPLLVLSSLRTVVVANKAIGRLVGIDFTIVAEDSEKVLSVTEALQGQTMAELNIDILQNGSLILMPWKSFLDSVLEEPSRDGDRTEEEQAVQTPDSGNSTPTATLLVHDQFTIRNSSLPRLSSTNLARTTVHNVAVDVVIAPLARNVTRRRARPEKYALYRDTLQADMIVSV
ncbi:hypothetical protein K469DRAFT_685659 [Zopfia rhizophila CBS 207.26]|uniref:Uncharacterized protein n=1 Tax=Zopfia rhizophila CBS 207.26 TaxID=1314779 RepID=A0A6A6E7J4_9PEZI|nr:hypothetical protein K469DRAFT_685659 [Zopfia rhizophila CBS 207.26]